MADTSPEFEEWVQRAREVDISAVAQTLGVILKRQGTELVGPCPACGGTDKFAVHPRKAVFNCGHQGGPGGDVIAMLMHAKGLTFVQACEDLTGEAPPRGTSPDRDPELERERRDERRDRDLAREEEERAIRSRKLSEAEQLWATRLPIFGTMADAYMRRRNIDLRLEQAEDLGFIPAHSYFGYRDGDANEQDELGQYPVMVAAIRDVERSVIGVHRTYLDARDPMKLVPPGDRKRNKAKKVFGTALGGAIWFGPPCACIALGEGIETVLSWYALARGPEEVTPVSSVSLGNMAGGSTGTLPHPKRASRTIPNGVPAAEKPGIILPHGARELILLGDGDSDRAWTLAMLMTAKNRFRAAGLSVQLDLAPADMDFNDVLARTLKAAA
jgi:hypothetical protein